MKKWLPLLIAFGAHAAGVLAQGPPVFTETPIMLGLDGGAVRTFGRYAKTESGSSYAQVIAVPYNLSAGFQAGAVLPLVWKNPGESDGRFGLSDATLFAKQQIFQKDGKAKTFRALLKATVSPPTGNTSKEPAIGSGAWQGNVGLAVGRISTRIGLYAEGGYQWVAEGGTDAVFYGFEASLPLLPQQYPPRQINLSAGLHGRAATEGGGRMLLFSPGLQYIAGRRFLAEAGTQIPLSQDAPEGQRFEFALLVGARVLIF